MHSTALRASVRDIDPTGVSVLAHVVADAVEAPAAPATDTTNNAIRHLRMWTPSVPGYVASRKRRSTWTKGRIEQPFALSSGVRGVQQHQPVAVPVVLDGGHQAMSREARVARLDADRAGIAEPQQRVVVVEPDLAALDRQRLDRAARRDDPRELAVVEHRSRHRGQVDRATVVALVHDAVGRREVRAAQAHLGDAAV